MKNLITILFLTLFAFSAQATSDNNKVTNEASDIARRMANQIELNELEYIQVRNYTIEKLETVASIKDLYKTNPEMLASKLDEVETDYTYRIQNLLNVKQMENYAAINKSFKTNPTFIATAE